MDPYRLGLVPPRLHYFELVGRVGSIRRAAQLLNVAPSSISRVIKGLEDELGTPLFERVRQRLKLTSAGELMLYRVRSSSLELRRAWSEINDLNGLHRGSVSIAIIESVSRGLMPEVLSLFWSRHPRIAVDIRVAGSQEACNAVSVGDCDLAVAFDVRPPRTVRKITSALLPLGVLALPKSRFVKRNELKLSDLSGERIILSDASLTLRRSIEDALGKSMIDLARRSTTNSINLMVEMAKRGFGLVLQTRVGVQQELLDGSLTFIPVRDPALSQRRLLLLSRSEKEMSGAASAMATFLAQAIEQLTP